MRGVKLSQRQRWLVVVCALIAVLLMAVFLLPQTAHSAARNTAQEVWCGARSVTPWPCSREQDQAISKTSSAQEQLADFADTAALAATATGETTKAVATTWQQTKQSAQASLAEAAQSAAIGLTHTATNTFAALGEGVAGAARGLHRGAVGSIKATGQGAAAAVAGAGSVVDTTGQALNAAWGGVKNGVTGTAHALTQAVDTTGRALSAAWSGVKHGATASVASAGGAAKRGVSSTTGALTQTLEQVAHSSLALLGGVADVGHSMWCGVRSVTAWPCTGGAVAVATDTPAEPADEPVHEAPTTTASPRTVNPQVAGTEVAGSATPQVVTNITKEYYLQPVIRETTREIEVGETRLVTRDFSHGQSNRIYDASSDQVNDLSSSLSESVTTDALSVTGASTLTGAVSFGGSFAANATSATSTVGGALAVGTTTANDTFTLDGAAYLAPQASVGATADRLYNQSSSLYWNGSLIAGATVGNWTTDGTHAWRTTGNVGIGTNSPSTTLEVAGTASTSELVVSGSATTSGRAYFADSVGIGTSSSNASLAVDGTATITGTTTLRKLLQFSGSAANIALGSNWLSGDGDDEGVFVDSSGNVGIGTSTPAYTLDIVGDGRFTGALTLDAALDVAGASTFTTFTAASGTTTNATSTNLYAGSLRSPAAIFTAATTTNAVVSSSLTLPTITGGTLVTDGAGAVTASSTLSASQIQDAYLRNTGDTATGNYTFTGTIDVTSNSFPQLTIDSAQHAGIFLDRGTSGYTNQFRFLTAGAERWRFGQTSAEEDLYYTYYNGVGGDAGWHDAFLIQYNTGNVGIGSTSPASKLTVAGDTHLGGNLTATGTLQLTAITGGLLSADGSGNITASSTLSASQIQDAYLRNTGDSISGNLVFQDNVKAFFGTGSDASIYYDGTDFQFDSQEAGTGDFIFNNGNVGIGETSPTSQLYIKSSGAATPALSVESASSPTADYFQVRSNGATAGDIFTIDSSGRVGIGTTSPSNTLEVNGVARFTSSSNGEYLRIVPGQLNGTADSNSVTLDLPNTGKLSVWDDFVVSGNVGIGTTSPQAKLDVAGGNVAFGDAGATGYTAPGGGVYNRSQVYFDLDNVANRTLTIQPVADGYSFGSRYTNTGGNRALIFNYGTTEAMRVANDGNIGIGTTSPRDKLHISGGSIAIDSVEGIDVLNGDNNSLLDFDFPDLSTAGGTVRFFRNTNTSGDAQIIVYAADGTNNPGAAIRGDGGNTYFSENGGNVGIGTTSPVSLLHLSGAAPVFTLTDTDTGAVNQVTANNGAGGLVFNADSANSVAGSYQRFLVDGSEAMRIDSSGNVGIGTNNPGNFKLAVTDRIAIQAGASGIPALYLQADAGNSNDARIRYTGNQSFAIRDDTAGADRLRINSSGDMYIPGNVGIGTTSPEYKLDVDTSVRVFGSTVSPYLLLEDTDAAGAVTFTQRNSGDLAIINSATTRNVIIETGGSEAMRIDSSGRLGIGDTSPSGLLSLLSNNPEARFEDSDSTNNAEITLDNNSLRLEADPDNNTANSFLKFQVDNSLKYTINSNGYLSQDGGDEGIYIDSVGSVGIGTANPDTDFHVQALNTSYVWSPSAADVIMGERNTAAGINLVTDNTGTSFIAFSDTAARGRGTIEYFHSSDDLVFDTAGSEKLRIDSSGNVGIGTTTPKVALDVDGRIFAGNSTTANTDGTYKGVFQSTGNAVLAVSSGSSNTSYFAMGDAGGNRLDGGLSYDNSANSFKLRTNGANRMTIDSSGNVGINTTDPSERLVVNGDMAVGNSNPSLPTDVWGEVIGIGSSATGNTTQAIVGSQGSYGLDLFWNFHRNSTNYSALNVNGFTSANGISMNDNGIRFVGTENMGTSYPPTNMIIKNSGNVGIGTASPSEIFHVYKSGNNTNLATFENPNSGTIGAADIEIIASSTKSILKTYNSAYSTAALNDSTYLAQTAGVGGLILGTETAAPIRFVTNGYTNERMTIDSSGNVGIGVTSPEGKMHVYTGSAGSISANAAADELILEGSGSTGMHIMSPDANFAQIYFGTPSDTVGGNVRWDYTNKEFVLQAASPSGEMRFDTNGSNEAMRIDSSGNVGIGTTTPGNILTVQAQYNLDGISIVGSGSPNTSLELNNGEGDNYRISISNSSHSEGADKLLIQDNTTSRFAIDSSGKVGIGETSPADKLDVDGDIRVGTGTTGCVKDSDGTTIAGTCSSDIQLKTDINTLHSTSTDKSYLEAMVALEPVNYRWNQTAAARFSYGTEELQTGLIAQQVQASMPELVTEGEDGFLQVRFSELPIYTIQALKELYAEVKSISRYFKDGVLSIMGAEFEYVRSESVNTALLCVGEVCVTEEEFAEVFGEGRASSSSDTSTNDTSSGGGADADSDTTNATDGTDTGDNSGTSQTNDSNTNTDTTNSTSTDTTTTDSDTSTSTDTTSTTNSDTASGGTDSDGSSDTSDDETQSDAGGSTTSDTTTDTTTDEATTGEGGSTTDTTDSSGESISADTSGEGGASTDSSDSSAGTDSSASDTTTETATTDSSSSDAGSTDSGGSDSGESTASDSGDGGGNNSGTGGSSSSDTGDSTSSSDTGSTDTTP